MTDRTGSAPVVAIVTDLDRTLAAPGVDLSPTARRAIDRAHEAGLRFVIASGRTRTYLAELWRRNRAVDGIVAENGCVVMASGPDGPVETIADSAELRAACGRMSLSGGAGLEFGDVSASYLRAEEDRYRPLVDGPAIGLVPNVDRVMVLPRPITKLSGVLAILDRLGVEPTGFAAIGDGENDLELLVHARLAGIPSNAVPLLRPHAGFVALRPMAEGVLDFVEYIAGAEVVPGLAAPGSSPLPRTKG